MTYNCQAPLIKSPDTLVNFTRSPEIQLIEDDPCDDEHFLQK